MSWFSNIFKKSTVRRRVVGPDTLQTLLLRGLHDLRSASFALRLSDRDYCTVTRAEVENVARRVWKPWVKDVADCDDQALVLVTACREAAFTEGGTIPWGVGFMLTAGPKAHAYTWALTQNAKGECAIEFYNQTSATWEGVGQLDCPVTLIFG